MCHIVWFNISFLNVNSMVLLVCRYNWINIIFSILLWFQHFFLINYFHSSVVCRNIGQFSVVTSINGQKIVPYCWNFLLMSGFTKTEQCSHFWVSCQSVGCYSVVSSANMLSSAASRFWQVLEANWPCDCDSYWVI